MYPFDDFSKLLSDFLNQLLYAIFNPIFQFLQYTIGSLISAINELFLFLLSIWGLLNTIISFFNDMLFIYLDSTWSAALMMSISLVFFLRIYYFAKDISIFGNKV